MNAHERRTLYRRALGLAREEGQLVASGGFCVPHGTLELGIIRDSQVNSVSDYKLFAETFENVARVNSHPGVIRKLDP